MQILEKAPKIRPITAFNLPEVKEYSGLSGIPIYEIEKTGCNVIKLELVFLAGRPYESKKLISTACAYMLREGCKGYSSEQISEQIDFFGASLNIDASPDTISIQMVCLQKHFDSVIDILHEILLFPTFPEKELHSFIQRRIERLKVDLSKSDVVSYRTVTEQIFGIDHPYGYNSTKELYHDIHMQDIKEHYDTFLVAQNCQVFFAGDINESHRSTLQSLLGSIRQGNKPLAPLMTVDPSLNLVKTKRVSISENNSQTSIKLGRRLFNRNHPDYPPLSFVSTLLGGYFSSRLVANIREKKGLTYGIYSMLDTLIYDGALIISTEVANQNVDLCIKEIYKEMDILCRVKVSKEEMTLVKNYLAGNYLNFFDGPFNSLRAIKSLVLSQIPLSELKSLIDVSQSITEEKVLEVSQKYLNRNDFWEVIVGNSTT